MIEPGALCYFVHKEEHSWLLGNVKSWDGKKGSCVSSDPKVPNMVCEKLKEDDIYPISKDVLGEDVNDLLSLTILHDATLLNCLKMRYYKDVIYTNIGAIVVALNPFNFKIPHYMDAEMPKYLAEGDRIETNIPHSWAVAHNTYYEMMNDQQNQCILVSGESGAGKTEASKIVMKYLGAISSKRGEDHQKEAAQVVGKKIQLASPILEAFGNARTVRNDNSSRFGKFMKVQFNDTGFLVGAFVIKYLLEKSRIITAAKGERVYHSFYLACRASTEFREKYNIGEDKTYTSLSSGKQFDNKEFNTLDDFTEVLDAMGAVGMNETEKDGVWRAVCGVLHIENTRFVEDGEGSKLDDKTSSYVDMCTQCWDVDTATMRQEFHFTTLIVAGTKVVRTLRPVQAYDGRDALVKTLYDEVFGWLVVKINGTLDVEEDCFQWVGLLDIFGFEDFDTGNYFEQLCINLANETIQGHYNQFIFQKDMDECRAEGIDVACIQFPDNTPCLHMIAGKGGILALLDEECSLGKGSDLGFLDAVSRTFAKTEFFLKKTLAKNSFIIHHYAGSVSYEVTGALDKNRDTLKDAYKIMMRNSNHDFIKELIAAPIEKTGKRVSVGGFFKNQLKDLMDLINSTNPHWIRCVKPHPAKKPLNFHGVSTMSQLGSSGVLGTVKIRKAGYPVRLQFDLFWPRYRVIALSHGKGSDVTLSQSLDGSKLVVFDILSWDNTMVQMGKTRVFLKAHAYIALEKAKKVALGVSAIKLQAAARWKTVLPIIRKKRWEASCRLIQFEFRDFMVRCAEIRKEREIRRKQLQAQHEQEREQLISEGLNGIEPIYVEFEAPLANWKHEMEQQAIDIEKMIEQFGDSRQLIRTEHASGAQAIELQCEKEFQDLQRLLLEMLLDCISLSENDARNDVKRIERVEREQLYLRLEEGFAFVDVLLYIESEVVVRDSISQLEKGARLELTRRWDIMEEEKCEWDSMMGVLLPKCQGVRKEIQKYQRRLQKREDIVRERQSLGGGGGGGGGGQSVGSPSGSGRHYVQCMPGGKPVMVEISNQFKDTSKPAWVGSGNVAALDQTQRATVRSREDLAKMMAPKAPPGQPSSPLSTSPKFANSSVSPQRGVTSPSGSPRRSVAAMQSRISTTSKIKPAAWEEAPRLTSVDPSSSIDHKIVGAAADALQKMGDQNPMFKPLFISSRTEVAAQLSWLKEQGAYKSLKFINPHEVRTLKQLRSAEATLRKYKFEHCEKMRIELARLDGICKLCKVPERHPVTMQHTRMTAVHKSLIVNYPPTTDVFQVVEEVTRLSTAIHEHKEEVLRVLLSAMKQGLIPPQIEYKPSKSSPPVTDVISEKVPYKHLKLHLDKSINITKYDVYVRCTSCNTFYRETVGRCWSCGGTAEEEFA